MIKLFAIDMDGTLLNSNSDISEKNIEAIKELNQAGIKTVLTSGRVSSSVDYFNEKIGIDNPMVANNGAVIKLSNEEVLATHPLDDDELVNLLEFCDENEFSFNFYDSNTFYTNRLIIERLNHLKIQSDYGMNYQCDIYVSSNPYKELKRRKHMANKMLISGLDSCRAFYFLEDKKRSLDYARDARGWVFARDARGLFVGSMCQLFCQ